MDAVAEYAKKGEKLVIQGNVAKNKNKAKKYAIKN